MFEAIASCWMRTGIQFPADWQHLGMYVFSFFSPVWNTSWPWFHCWATSIIKTDCQVDWCLCHFMSSQNCFHGTHCNIGCDFLSRFLRAPGCCRFIPGVPDSLRFSCAWICLPSSSFGETCKTHRWFCWMWDSPNKRLPCGHAEIPSAEIVNLGMVYHMVILLAVWFNRQIYGNVIGVSMQHM